MSDDRTFRVVCLNPVNDLFAGGQTLVGGSIVMGNIEKLVPSIRICSHGTGMTIEEMNENIVLEGRPYIEIPYCKYCYTGSTIGVLDEDNEVLAELLRVVIKRPGDYKGDDGKETYKRFEIIPIERIERE